MFDNQFQRVLLCIYKELGGPIAEVAANLTREGKWGELFSLRVSPRDYQDPETFWRDNQVCELVRKLDVPGNRMGLDKAALDTFKKCESACHLTNIRLNKFLYKSYDEVEDLRIQDFLGRARSFIKLVLGRLPSDLNLKFGKGSTYSDKGNLITIPDKMSSQPTSTSSAHAYRHFIDTSAWGRARYNDTSRQIYSFFESAITRGNRFTTVAKDNSKRRGICIEPSVNVALQLAVGSHMKRRLRDVALLDLYNNQLYHRDLARRASRDGTLATIDLSNASDTVSKSLVKLLLPACWFELLDDLRSKTTLLPSGEVVYLEKFSSMGNGFTFELETLLFASILHATGAKIGVNTWVYGDDIIIPTELAHEAIAALKFFGFTPNESKTYVDGPFRESCGGDFFDGVSVRAHYITKIPCEPSDWFSLHNGLRRSARGSAIREFRLSFSMKVALDAVPSRLRNLRGPETFGDLVIHSDEFTRIWDRPDVKDDARGIGWIRCLIPYTPVISYEEGCWHPEVVLAAALYGCPSQGVTERGVIHGYRVGWLACS